MDNHSMEPKPARILVIVMRYLGDVLLTTPLIRSLRIAYPNAQLDVLVYDNTAAILVGNKDVDNIITTPMRAGCRQYIDLVKRLFRRYDWAVVTQTGDRPFLYGVLSASFRVAAVPPKAMTGWWKRLFVQRWLEFDDNHTHTVLQHLKLLDLIDVPKHFTVVPPQAAECVSQFAFLSDDYVVFHPFPQWTYKRWTVKGWVEIGHFLRERGLRIVLSGGPSQEELDYIETIARQLPVDTVNLAGRTSLAQLAHIIARAELYVGPDTGITHLAAATAVPVIAIYGPTNPVKWSPWPNAHQRDSNPFHRVGTQQVNNVYLVQGGGVCVPCHQEGCERHRLSHSECLSNLTAKKIQDIALSILQKENSG